MTTENYHSGHTSTQTPIFVLIFDDKRKKKIVTDIFASELSNITFFTVK